MIIFKLMETLFDTISSNPIYIAILTILAVLLVYAIIKKTIKLIISIGLILTIYAFYLNYTGQEVPKNVNQLKDSVSGNVSKAKEVASEVMNNAKKSTKKIVEEKTKEKLDQILSE
tara:strand:+ start:150 stop:497 length:348 start_codon:yes stop_codon:yes gene_type:complete